LIAELKTGQLGLGFVGEIGGVVFGVINIDGGHKKRPFRIEKPRPLVRDGVERFSPKS
jgi:hypothetical protein